MAKRIEDMTHAEVMAMTDEEVAAREKFWLVTVQIPMQALTAESAKDMIYDLIGDEFAFIVKDVEFDPDGEKR